LLCTRAFFMRRAVSETMGFADFSWLIGDREVEL
jgi:hypothetical protein